MPTYQYACTQCDERLEAVQSFTDAPLTECPVCGGRLRKVFSAVGVVFKGSGFYKTDSRSNGKAGSDGGSSSTAAKDGGSKDSGGGSTESSKPAAATNGSGSGSGSGSSGSKDSAKPAASTPASKSA